MRQLSGSVLGENRRRPANYPSAVPIIARIKIFGKFPGKGRIEISMRPFSLLPNAAQNLSANCVSVTLRPENKRFRDVADFSQTLPIFKCTDIRFSRFQVFIFGARARYNGGVKILLEIGEKNYRIAPDEPLSLAIPLAFNAPQPNAFGVEKAVSQAYQASAMIGDTRRGGSCNFERVEFIPHCNGTHTECVGHITDARIAVHDCLREAFIPAILISVEPEKASDTAETYPAQTDAADWLITRRTVAASLDALKSADFPASALIVRTLPNDESKLTRVYDAVIPPFFSTEAMTFIVEKGFTHLLADTPSIDRLYDEGRLSNHRIFWNLAPGSRQTAQQTRRHSTITELIFVPAVIADGAYLLNLQIAPFAADAAPSRPILYRAERLK